MTFAYKFDRVLKINQDRKQLLEVEYQKLYDQLETVGGRLVTLLQQKEAIQNQLSQDLSNKVAAGQIIEWQNHMKILETLITDVKKKYDQKKEELEAMNGKLVAQSKEVKKFEKHKENRFYQHLDDVKKIDSRQMDEVASQQFFRQ